MVLAREWRRRMYSSLALSVIVPVALLGSLVVLAVGGLPRLSELGQAFTGPSAPAAASPRLGGSGTRSPVAAALVALQAPGAARVPLAAVPSAAAPTSPPSTAPIRSPSPGSGLRGDGLPITGQVGPPSEPPGPTHHSRPPASQPATPVDAVVRKATPVTSTLPPPAGPVVTGTLKSAGAVADGILRRVHR